MKSHQNSIGNTNEWLTPLWILSALGKFDLDPCSPEERPWDTASKHLTIKDDGLTADWNGRVWCNPPFDRRVRHLWMRRMANHGNGILLVPAACETKAFQDHVWGRSDGILFLNRRPHFHDIAGRRSKANSGCTIALVAYGGRNLSVLKESNLGPVLIQV